MANVAIIGAGLAGSLLAIYLAKRGIKVDVYEARGDMRLEEVAAGRSINLALSDRGIAALREVGMDEYMLAEAVPMLGRMIHTPTGETKLLPYSGRHGEYINSVSRSGLNVALMNEAEKYDGVNIFFNHRLSNYDIENQSLTFEQTGSSELKAENCIEITGFDTMIATDGAGSAVRHAMEKQLEGYKSSTVFLDHGYKELHIPPAEYGGFRLVKNALHIWPRHQFMMIALPNFDGSFTCTLFLAHKSVPPASAGGKNAAASPTSGFASNVHTDGANRLSADFARLDSENAVSEFFNREFADAVPLMPTLVEDFFDNPTGNLGTLKCWPWSIGGKALLLGDAAHAIVPFYGQGMNCAFEDVRVLASLIDEQVLAAEAPRRGDLSEPEAVATGSTHATNDLYWEKIFTEYGRLRKINTDAIADMAEENFYEMRDKVADPVFQRKRELETKLEQTYPDYFSKYSMVTFREDLPYSEAKRRGNAQDALLMAICRDIATVNELDISDVIEGLRHV
jgi:kynurenine 3-monooxygenase